VPNITQQRRANVMALFQQFAKDRLAAGETPKGLEQAFAKALEISPSMWSQIKSSRPISDKLARQIESHMDQPPGCLDEQHGDEAVPDAAEERFVAAARAAWRTANAKEKRVLMRAMSPSSRAAASE